MNARVGVQGRAELEVISQARKPLKIVIPNMVVDQGLQYFAWMTKEMLGVGGAVAAPNALRVSVGTSSQPVWRTNTMLGGQYYVQNIDTATQFGNVSRLDVQYDFADGNGIIREIGLVGTWSMASTLTTDGLIARVVLPEPGIIKTVLDKLNISWFITFRRYAV